MPPRNPFRFGPFWRLSILALISAFISDVARAAEHPGNIFVAGEDVSLTVPADWKGWRAVDIAGSKVGGGDGADVHLGKLPIGYFEILEPEGTRKMTAGVVAPNEALDDTPIALDAAMSWFYADPKQICDASRLCRLAGVKWVRDRASWPELETARGTWAGQTRYERAMRIQHEMGLKILQVNHISPTWASADVKRFPEDLRDVFNFYRGLADRWKTLVDAIEPWNEPDIDVFGGHTGCEIASFQKAAYLGLKAGNPDLPVNLSVFAIDRPETLDDFGDNAATAYFDRYDLHHYIRLPEYSRAYARHRAVSGGRPMWTTEFNLTVHWANEKTHEPSEDELRVQGFRVGKVFAQALHEGTEKAFYFILGHYVERNLQYGIVHTDLTPRPAYIAFAAVGRLLNGAKPIGRVDFGDEKLKGYLFKTEVDGKPCETLVTWSETKPTTVSFPGAERAFDYLGRAIANANKTELSRETIFVMLPPGGSKVFKIEPPPAHPPRVDAKASPVVLQLIGHGDVKRSAFQLEADRGLKLAAYNFGDKPSRGKLVLTGAEGAPAQIDLDGGERKVWDIRVVADSEVSARVDLDGVPAAVVSARVVPVGAPTQGIQH